MWNAMATQSAENKWQLCAKPKNDVYTNSLKARRTS